MYRRLAEKSIKNIERCLYYDSQPQLSDTAIIHMAIVEMEELEWFKDAYETAIERGEAYIKRLLATEGNEGVVAEIRKIFAK